MVEELFLKLRQTFVGRPFTAEQREADWSFAFGTDSNISTASDWRFVDATGIKLSSKDDGHQFGLPTPINVERQANDQLGSSAVVAIEIDYPTGDLNVFFDSGIRLHIYNSSMGYESWMASFQCDGEEIGLVGGGGGAVGYYRHDIASKPRIVHMEWLAPEVWNVR
jgi:hypothetical protein